MICAYCGRDIDIRDLTWINNRRWHTACFEDTEAARYETYITEHADD